MDNKSTTILLSIALAGFLILAAINAITHYNPALKETLPVGSLALDQKDIKGMAIEKGGKVYTLNLKQQSEALSYINKMLVVDKKDYANKIQKFDYKIIVYRFDKPEITFDPVAREDEGLVFDVPMMGSTQSYMLDMSGGSLESLIQKASQP